ncbi:hypothetical protein EVJ58_g4598 [Rhodofomes roseus]|uniref:C2H2-type domain-containing protein n=1 Tax=Rhodofomes roseus TaxID=34475 RepID=A0A4Y9YHH2_9APHY|nr:hypothetical protein EVJ58_g4598 [Rhodofomes roseus]
MKNVHQTEVQLRPQPSSSSPIPPTACGPSVSTEEPEFSDGSRHSIGRANSRDDGSLDSAPSQQMGTAGVHELVDECATGTSESLHGDHEGDAQVEAPSTLAAREAPALTPQAVDVRNTLAEELRLEPVDDHISLNSLGSDQRELTPVNRHVDSGTPGEREILDEGREVPIARGLDGLEHMLERSDSDSDDGEVRSVEHEARCQLSGLRPDSMPRKGKPLSCAECGKAFKTFDAYQSHASAKGHDGLAQQSMRSSRNVVTEHLNTITTSDIPPNASNATEERTDTYGFQCQHCKAWVVYESDLPLHYSRSAGHPKCPFCKVGFKDRPSLESHVTSDRGDTGCKRCYRMSNSAEELRIHHETVPSHASIDIASRVESELATGSIRQSSEDLGLASQTLMEPAAEQSEAYTLTGDSLNRPYSPVSERVQEVGVDSTAGQDGVISMEQSNAPYVHKERGSDNGGLEADGLSEHEDEVVNAYDEELDPESDPVSLVGGPRRRHAVADSGYEVVEAVLEDVTRTLRRYKALLISPRSTTDLAAIIAIRCSDHV